MRLDANGLPIHGLLTACPDWELGAREAGPERATLEARLDFGAGLLAAFPFPHRLELAIELAGAELSVAATLCATGDVPVPVSFGWHPYLTPARRAARRLARGAAGAHARRARRAGAADGSRGAGG